MRKLQSSAIRPPFAFSPAAIDVPLIFTSPHSGRHYPSSFLEQSRLDLLTLRRVEDAYIDLLLEDVHAVGAAALMANYARSYLDLNRSDAEIDSRMFVDGPPTPSHARTPRLEAGFGCIPKLAADGQPIYANKLHRKDVQQRLDEVYYPFHEALNAQLTMFKARSERFVLIDCHSMPSLVAGRRIQADIVLGTRHGVSCDPELADLIDQHFSRAGYSVVRNLPYAGGFLTELHGNPVEDAHAIQIEFNRSLYLNEKSVELKSDFKTLRAIFSELALYIANWAKKSRA